MVMTMAQNKPSLPPLWFFVPGFILGVAGMFLGLNRWPHRAIEFGLLAPSFAGMLYCFIRSSFARALAVFVVTVYWVGLGALAILMLADGLFLLLYYGIFIVPAVAIIVFATRSARKRMASLWITVGAGLGFACGVVAIVIAITPAIREASHRASIFPTLAAPVSRSATTAQP